MKSEKLNDTEKIIRAEEGMVLTNGGEFADYPVELICNITDTSWYEIKAPIKEENDSEFL